MSKLRFHNRFINVGVYISIYALLTGGQSLYLPVLDLYSTHVQCYCSWCVGVDYPRHGHVLYGTIIIKAMCVHHLYLQGWSASRSFDQIRAGTPRPTR